MLYFYNPEFIIHVSAALYSTFALAILCTSATKGVNYSYDKTLNSGHGGPFLFLYEDYSSRVGRYFLTV